MRRTIGLVVFVCFLMLGGQAKAQVKDMPSQAEFDPILENADSKVKDFLGTLTKYSGEARQINEEKLENDLRDYGTVREMIQRAHSGTGDHGISFSRVFSIVASLDDAAIEARVWSNMLTARVYNQNKQSVLFALAVLRDAEMLKEVSNQLFHSGFRMMVAADEIMSAMANKEPKSQPK
jgi:hypothetical protein